MPDFASATCPPGYTDKVLVTSGPAAGQIVCFAPKGSGLPPTPAGELMANGIYTSLNGGGGYAGYQSGYGVGDFLNDLGKAVAGEVGNAVAGWLGASGNGGTTKTKGLVADTSVGPCPEGTFSVGGQCVDLQPGGATQGGGMILGDWEPVRGLYGVGVVPKVEERATRICPPEYVVGKDGICYDGLPKSKRKWDPGMKPLMTGGDRAAIRKAAAAGRKLDRSKKQLKKAARALEKAC